MNEEKLVELINQSFVATNKRMNELIEITMNQRDEISYLKAHIKVLAKAIEQLEDKIVRLQ